MKKVKIIIVLFVCLNASAAEGPPQTGPELLRELLDGISGAITGIEGFSVRRDPFQQLKDAEGPHITGAVPYVTEPSRFEGAAEAALRVLEIPEALKKYLRDRWPNPYDRLSHDPVFHLNPKTGKPMEEV